MAKKDINKSDIMNEQCFLLYLDRLTDLAINTFEWVNLPAEIDERFLEYHLFLDGYILFLYDDIVNKYVVSKTTIGGRWNIYDTPIERVAYTNNGIQWQCDNQNSVIIYNNRIRTDTQQVAIYYAKKLTEIERTMDVNLMHTITPYIVGCDEKRRLTIKNMFNKVFNKEPVIIGTKDIEDFAKNLQVFNLNTKFQGLELNELKKQIFNEYLTCIGVPNVTVNKKERLVSDEVERNQGGVIAQQLTRLNTRKEACKKINEMFGLNIDVRYKEMETDETGGVDDGRIHNTGTNNIN